MSRRAASLASILPPIAIGVAVFLAWMHPAVLDPRNVGWLLDGNDRGVTMLGTAAYLKAGAWPWLRQPLLGAPEGLPLLFTDSIPLIGLIAKPLGAPATWQFVGPWYLLCMLLTAGFAWALVRPRTAEPVAAWAGTAMLTGLPILLNRYGHPSLCAQWLVWWAVWIYLDERRAGSAGWWSAVLGVAALVHSYLVVMVATVWGGSVLAGAAAGRLQGRGLGVLLVPPVVVAVLLGLHGVLSGGAVVPSGLYGAWPMALDAWWNPANSDYAMLIPSSPDDGTGRGFEGLQYLGAGLIALVPVAVVAAWRGGSKEGRRLLWLAPGFAVLLILAIGPAPVWRGIPLWTVEVPRAWREVLDPVRAAGRLAWPVTIVLALWIVATVGRTRRATLLLGAAAALQIADLSGMAVAVRRTSARADDRTVFSRTLDPRWGPLIAGAGSIAIEPPLPFGDLAVLEEVAWRAVAACRPLRYFYAARDRRATRARLSAETAAFRAGRIDPTRMYVVLDGSVPRAVERRAIRLDGVMVVPPLRPSPPAGECPASAAIR